jgi:hypothetical protein
MLKVFVVSFECWRFLLILLDIEGSYFYFLMLKGYYFYFWMFKVLIFGFRCWKFLFILLDIEGSYFCSSMLKVHVLIIKCWNFLLLDVEGSYFYSWMLKVCDCCSFVYLHILKKNYVKIYSIYLKVDCTSLVWTYNDEKFMKGDLLMISMLHMSCFLFEHLWWLLLFLCYRAEISSCFNPSRSKLCIQGKIISKVPKFVIQFTWL